MKETDYNAKLYEKMKTEQEAYRSWLVLQSGEEILHHAYEYTVRADIVMAMEYLELEPGKAKALLKSPCPLSDVFTEFERTEFGYMDNIRDCIESRADKVIRLNKEREAR